MSKVKKIIIILLICILVVILLIIGLYFYGLTSVSKDSEKVIFNIETGTSTKEIVNNLYESNLIKSRISSLIYIKLNNNIIKAGTYELDRKYNAKEIIEELSGNNAINDTITITFIEGKRLTHYVSLISEKFGYSENEILDTISDTNYLKELISKYDFLTDSILNSNIYYPLEGYLFPDTYEFYKNASIKDIIEKMLDKTQNVLDNNNALLMTSDYSIHEILTMASIIENETMYAEDRNIVSQVIYKRLNMKISLGMDVTTYYAAQIDLGESDSKISPYLNDYNAYNTRNKSFIGLPVGPISNPSQASIKAALSPSDTDYLFFYADKKGKLHFAKTDAEHEENIKKYS